MKFLNFSDGRNARPPRAGIIAIAGVASQVGKRNQSNEPITINPSPKRRSQVANTVSEAIASMSSMWCRYVCR
ncbi:hypothetical protein Y027_5010 [Burkholderia pseudomallei TSV5]|nr:hypothetical protein DO64_5382 [Burkholderia pseudomallei]KGS27310.1 hypothetical protein X941_4080 [Burkholderia pseudomallei MSHR5569]KGX52021.1 hypothetical protein Y027_5010 [Burkholderia pseudomallei TSV5]KGX57090.1 hypothetical protein Y025_3705 [Burkholderia pseudomallei TSV32]KGD22451.1 hypothetical protein DP42_3719 [Burkholderia pseudomallei]